LPNLGKREAATARTFFAFVIERDGKFLVQQRPVGIVNAHLWEFPNFETNGEKKDAPEILIRLSISRRRNFSRLAPSNIPSRAIA
jgi:adenine-specific DNA glycosylase